MEMWPKKLFVVYFFAAIVESEHHSRKRKGRLFSFNTLDNDITVDLDFSVPFLSIPVKRTIESTFGTLEFPIININPASLALGGAVVLGTTVLGPLLLKTYTAYAWRRYSRILENTEFGSEALINFIADLLSDTRSIRGCTLRIACWTAQRNYSDSAKVIHQMVSNKLMSSIVNSTAIEDAMLSGINGRDCMTYNPCPVREEYIPMIINNIAGFIKAHN